MTLPRAGQAFPPVQLMISSSVRRTQQFRSRNQTPSLTSKCPSRSTWCGDDNFECDRSASSNDAARPTRHQTYRREALFCCGDAQKDCQRYVVLRNFLQADHFHAAFLSFLLSRPQILLADQLCHAGQSAGWRTSSQPSIMICPSCKENNPEVAVRGPTCLEKCSKLSEVLPREFRMHPRRFGR
jgi:hypothetical protein